MGKGRKEKERLAKEKGHEGSGEASDEERGKGGKKRTREKRRSRPGATDRNQSRERTEEHSREKNQNRNGKEHAQESDRGKKAKRSKERHSRKEGREHETENSAIDEGSQPKHVSLSIEETNKLRASLGLKALVTDNQEENNQSQSVLKEDIHVPPVNIGSLQAAEKLKEKFETMKVKRMQYQELSAIKTLGEAGVEETTSEWVQKMKTLQDEKEKAEKRAHLLDEMDEEFGVVELIHSAFQEHKQKSYTAKDLKGLTVEHKLDEFPEEKGVVLTLKDARILDDAEDILVSANIVDAEKATQNILRKKRKEFNPYDEEEVEEMGPARKVLKKYDEEIDGVKKANFEIGDFGGVDTSMQRQAMVVKERLKAQALTLEQEPAQIASEYYSTAEMAKFRKPKKKRKVRRLKADDLLNFSVEGNFNADEPQDHGSRTESMSRQTQLEGSEADSSLTNEGEDPVIENVLHRAHQLLKQKRPETSRAARVAEMISCADKTSEEEQEPGDAIVLDKTAEFCRQLGEEDAMESHHKFGDHEVKDANESINQEVLGCWTEVEPNAPESGEAKEEELYQEAEPVVSSGLSAALQMAVKKGFVDTEKKKKDSSQIVHIYGNVQRDREYERQKERERERELSHLRSASFPEKREYSPIINIEYVDDKGRALTPKEAFRYMSHKFHGRGSGKKKTEKRLKKLQEEHFMNRSSSIDTPLNTLAMLQVKQKKSQTPYILLSGGSQSMLAPDLEKK